MTQFLLFFSLIMHGITFVFIIFLFRRNAQQKDMDHLKQTVREVEDLFEAYLLEIKDENSKLLNILSENGKNVKERKMVADVEAIKEEFSHNLTKQPTYQPVKNPFPYQAPKKRSSITSNQQVEVPSKVEEENPPKQYNPESLITKDNVEEPSIQSNVLHLYQQGLSTEEIAKKLNKGKTEIELIIKFHSKP